MNPWERWSFNALHVVVAATGVAYFYMKYLLRSDDPFAVINHPWESSMLAVHIMAAPFFILIFGILLRSHILTKLLSNNRPARRSGWLSILSFTGMAVSGYLLQIGADQVWLRVLMVTHIGTSVVFVIGYVTHLVVGWRLPKTTAVTQVPTPFLPGLAP